MNWTLRTSAKATVVPPHAMGIGDKRLRCEAMHSFRRALSFVEVSADWVADSARDSDSRIYC